MRVNIIGTSGSGKSTLARRLSEKLAIPYIEMDALFWLKDWQERTDADFFNGLKAHWSLKVGCWMVTIIARVISNGAMLMLWFGLITVLPARFFRRFGVLVLGHGTKRNSGSARETKNLFSVVSLARNQLSFGQ